tara:strand:+ start:427 stop:909 length:483 start_codon:yes stop_codon:yes gene_type:complete
MSNKIILILNMKSFINLVFLIIPFVSLSQSSRQIDKSEVKFYGNKFSLIAESNQNKNGLTTATTRGKILSSCPKKGCWVKVISGSEEIFITFKDYSFFVPTNGIAGKNIIIKGKIKVDTISVSKLKHYAFDAGESEDYISKIIKPEITKSIIADGVAIID